MAILIIGEENPTPQPLLSLQELGNVKEAVVSHETGKAILQVDAPSLFDAWNQLPQILETIDALGFTSHPCLGDAEE